jgi:hypothetical protein
MKRGRQPEPELRYHSCVEAPEPMSEETQSLMPVEEEHGGGALRVITWFSMGMAVAALGLFLGHELRIRYKFKRRTPYDFYASAGEQQASEFGMGI